MEKYTIPGKQISFRMTDDQKDTLQGIFDRLQTEKQNHYTSMREAIIEMIKNYAKMEDELNDLTEENYNLKQEVEKLATAEPEKEVIKETPEEIKELLTAIKKEVYEDESLSDLTVITEMIKTINTPTPAVEIVKEKELSPGEHLIRLSENQEQILNVVNNWRKQKGKDTEEKTPEETLKELVFNVGTLTNEHGGYETGLRYSRNSKKLVTVK